MCVSYVQNYPKGMWWFIPYRNVMEVPVGQAWKVKNEEEYVLIDMIGEYNN